MPEGPDRGLISLGMMPGMEVEMPEPRFVVPVGQDMMFEQANLS